MDVNELSIHEKYMSRCIEIAKKIVQNIIQTPLLVH